MDENIKLRILESVGKIYEQSKECKLENSFFHKIDSELYQLSEYFKTTKIQAFFIAIVFAMNYKGNTVDIKDLIEHFDCNPMKVLEFNDDFEFLYSKGIFNKQKSKHRMKLASANDQFTINEKIAEAILKNKPMPEIGLEAFTDIIELLEKLDNIREQRDDNEITTMELFNQTEEIISSNLHFPLIKKVGNFNFSISDAYLYLYLIYKTVSGNETLDIGIALEGIFDNPSKRINYMQKFLSGENVLLKNNLIEIVEAKFFNDTEMKLTDYSLSILNECEIKLFVNRKKKDNIIKPEEISLKQLIFNDEEMNQLALMKDLLEESNLTTTQSRLISKGLPKGITVLFHGSPGTGKTETAKQLAKETNREIMKVEISQSKSMWFGESEKIVKRIFTDYKSFYKECKRTPILLFNEADAIISKRREIGNSGVHQTENAIQNIILEELENFEGILIATTNLATNFDSAFERRFLFKIEFNKPNCTVKARIWKMKLPNLTEMECELLASQFDFSGGQIDNVVRKNEINEIINGSTVNFNSILDFCREETLGNSRVRIGFSKIV